MASPDNDIEHQHLIKAANCVPLETLRLTMNTAFADYAVPMQLGADAFASMMRIRGLSTDHSQIALVDGCVAAFWLVGVRASRAYLIASGTVPSFRQKRLSHSSGTAVMEALRRSGFTTLQSEVLEINASARGLYRSLGFSEVRDLDCYTLPGPKVTLKGRPIPIDVCPNLPPDAA